MFRPESLIPYQAPNTGRHVLKRSVMLVGVLWTVIQVTACTMLGSTATPTVRPTVVPTQSPTMQASNTSVPQQVTPTSLSSFAPITLTVWVPPEMALSAQSTDRVFHRANASFEAENPTVNLEVVPKAAYGTAGLVSAFLATQPVVPARLPDLLAVDTAQVRELASESILVPLDELLPSSIWSDLFPVALQTATIDGRRMAIPFQMDVYFAVYNTALIENPPRTWDDLETTGAKYIFPAGQGDGSAADALLVQYLAEGGKLLRDSGQPYLDPGILATVLTRYRRAVEAGAVPVEVRRLTTLDDCWAAYMQGTANMTQVSSSQYNREKGSLKRTVYTPIVTGNGVVATLTRSWSWVIVTDDPAHQKAAARYLESLLDPDTAANWCAESLHLPALQSVLPLAVQDDAYRSFLEEQLEGAYAYPDLYYYVRLQSIMVQAIGTVMDGTATPERAAITAAAAAARLR